jgi:hypothetical protein
MFFRFFLFFFSFHSSIYNITNMAKTDTMASTGTVMVEAKDPLLVVDPEAGAIPAPEEMEGRLEAVTEGLGCLRAIRAIFLI